MIRLIARKEMLELARDGRLRWTAAILLILLAASAVLGWTRYRDLAAQHEAARRATREHWLSQPQKNPHSAAHYGIYAFKPKLVTSFIDDGVDPYTGVVAWLEAHKQNEFRWRPAQDATASQRAGLLTAAVVLQLLVPLLIVLLTYGTFAGEREVGTLRQLLSLGVAPRQLAAGKAIGTAGVLLVVLLPATVLGVLALALFQGPSLASSWGRVTSMSIVYLLYFVAWTGIGLAISARARTARVALVTLLSLWMINGLLAPRVVTDLARRISPTPSALDFSFAMARDLEQGFDGHGTRDQRTKALEARVLRQYGVDSASQLPVSFAGIALQEGEEYGNKVFDRHYSSLWNRFRQQEEIREWGGIVAPLLAVRALSMALAGTDVEHHLRFQGAAETYRRYLVKHMNDYMTVHAAGADFGYLASPELWATVTDFEYESPSTVAVLSQHPIALALALGWALAATLAAAVATRRLTPEE